MIIILLFSCKEKKDSVPNTKVKSKELKQNIDWLIGNWKRTNEEKGKETYENWIKKSVSEYVGIGFTMKGKDTISSEHMTIIEKDGKWKLVVSVIGKGEDTSATIFEMIEKTNTSFTCENKEIDFPNLIHYETDGKIIKAEISNSEMRIPFEFIQLKK